MGFPAFGTADRLRRREQRRPAMARVADHLSVSALEQHYRSCKHATAARHFHTIWLLAKGHQISEVAATVCFAPRWVERLLARYNAQGPHALGDLRCRNGPGSRRTPARLGGAEGARLVRAEAPSPPPPCRNGRGPSRLREKNWPRRRPRKPPNTRTKPSRSGPRMSTASG